MPYPPTGGEGGVGPLVLATRSDNGNPAVFTNIAARDAYAATTDGMADANSINVSVNDDARFAWALGTLDGSGNVTSVDAAYIRVNNSWVAVAVHLITVDGPGNAPSTPMYAGFIDSNDLSMVVVSNLTEITTPQSPQAISTGAATQGQYFVILVNAMFDATRIEDDSDVNVLPDSFTVTTDALTENGVLLDAYVVGPFPAGFSAEYSMFF